MRVVSGQSMVEAYAGRGRPVVVLGGGPRLPADLRRVRDLVGDDVTAVSVNHHGAMAAPCHYAVGLDFNFRTALRRASHLLAAGLVPIAVGPFPNCDVELAGVPRDWSAPVAVDFALKLEPAGPVLLAGFDLYQGGGSVYWHGLDERPAAFGASDAFCLDRQLAMWRRWRADRWRGRAVYAVGGPLEAVFPTLNPGGSSRRTSDYMRGGSADDTRRRGVLADPCFSHSGCQVAGGPGDGA